MFVILVKKRCKFCIRKFCPEQSKSKFGGVAQLGEHLPCKQGVRSSILLISINFLKEIRKYSI